MNLEELLKFVNSKQTVMLETMRRKNADYTGNAADVFDNFTFSEREGCIPAEHGFYTRMGDKFKRLGTFVKRGELAVKSESVEDTLMDLANYCLLFAAYLYQKRQNTPSWNETRGL